VNLAFDTKASKASNLTGYLKGNMSSGQLINSIVFNKLNFETKTNCHLSKHEA
jgi:hypothetical protein